LKLLLYFLRRINPGDEQEEDEGKIRMKIIILSLLLISSAASAALLEDVKILSINPRADYFEMKLQLRDGPPGSYFYVDIVKSDPHSFEKLVQVIHKLTKRDRYKLDLEIRSFSAFPSGSYYRSNDVIFNGSADREPNGVKRKKRKKKK